MGKKFVGLDGLKHFWKNAKAWIIDRITTEVTEAISGKADKSHTHTKSEITDFDHIHDDRYYTESEVDAKLSADLADKQDFRIFKSLEEFNEKKGTSLTVVSGIDNMKDIANAMNNGEMLIIITKYELQSDVYFGLTTSTGWTKMFTFIKSNGLCDVECRTTFPLTLKRVLNSDGVIGEWQQLATTDSTLKTIQLSESVDCNTLTELGLYTASASEVSELTNAPTNAQVQLDGGFSILVTKTNIDNVYYGIQMFIPYGSDLPFMRKSYYLNGQHWTSWKGLCATTVEDVPKTYINTFENETYVKPSNTYVCSYSVTNGICVIKLEVVCLSTTDDFVQILSGLPKPKEIMYSNAIDRTMSSNSEARGLFQLVTNGTLRITCSYGDSSVSGVRNFYATFSYLVAES